VEQDVGEQVRMAPEEFSIYDLVDGVRTVAEIQELAPTHDFNTMSVLSNLMGAGLIIQSGDARSPSGRTRGEGATGKRGLPRGIAVVLLWAAGLALLAFTVPRLEHNPLNILIRDLGDGDRSARLCMLRVTTRMHRLEERLEAYRLEQGRYPETLSGLVEEGFAVEDDLVTRDSRSYAYRATEDRFTLRAPGVSATEVMEDDEQPAD
jgi:hypothetical protein